MFLQEVLLLKEQHLKEMAAVASVMAPAPASAAAHADEKAKAAAPLGEAHKSLLTQLEVLRNESRRMQETFMEERRLLVEESQSKLGSQVC
jgi:ribosomal protein L12E/L44/L45/RPP1/RPP2